MTTTTTSPASTLAAADPAIAALRACQEGL